MQIGGHTISYPTYDIETIGAGGGSLAWIDSGGTLRVGPAVGGQPSRPRLLRARRRPPDGDRRQPRRSAATTSRRSSAGRCSSTWSSPAARSDAHVAEPLGMSVEAGGRGHPAHRQRADDQRRAGHLGRARTRRARLHARRLRRRRPDARRRDRARARRSRACSSRRFPGCASAFGAVISGSRRDFLRTVGRTLGSHRRRRPSRGSTRSCATRARDALADEGFATDAIEVQTWLDVRYEGQAHELSVELPGGRLDTGSLGDAVDAFHALHRQLYGHAFDDVPVEVVNLRVKGLAGGPQPDMWWDWARAVGAGGAARAGAARAHGTRRRLRRRDDRDARRHRGRRPASTARPSSTRSTRRSSSRRASPPRRCRAAACCWSSSRGRRAARAAAGRGAAGMSR